MKTATNCIIVPVYKPFSALNDNERLSLYQLYQVLRKHPICLIGPEEFDFTSYLDHAATFGITINVRTFKKDFFADIAGYNRLLLSPGFYRAFKNYEYILIYQTDAYVFRDDLEFWCAKGYDYIGAPWFEGFHLANESSRVFGVGNGGFSLRKVKTHLRVLYRFSYIIGPRSLLHHFNGAPLWRKVTGLLSHLTLKNNTFFLFNDTEWNEDYFWGKIVSQKFSWFRVPDPSIASQFSMEVNAPLLYHQNGDQLPFGCHKWDVYNPVFWSKFIREAPGNILTP